MKRLIFTTIILLIATVLVTVVYFKNLHSTTQQTSDILRTIPNNASLIFEFNNEKGFYDIFNNNELFTNLIGEDKMDELRILKKKILLNPLIQPYLDGQNLYISMHPQKGNNIDFLVTIAAGKGFDISLLDKLAKQKKNGVVLNTFSVGEQQVYVIYLNDLKRRFYLISRDEHTLSGSFSKELIESCARYSYLTERQAFVLLSDKQSDNSLANLYVNYEALSPLFEQIFVNKNTDLFRNFRQLPAFAALSLNYKSDALMFNGTTQIQEDADDSYMALFTNQQPITNHLKGIFPSTTAYSTNFAVSDPAKFERDLADLDSRSDFRTDRAALIKKIKKETGLNLTREFSALLGNEFAKVTTRYHEKIAIIQVKDGSKVKALLANVSQMNEDNTGQFNYEDIPQLLLGDAFNIFKKPYFKVFDNYLVFTNSMSELTSYDDSYYNRKFLNRTDGYSQFDALLAERSNVSFFVQFRNAGEIFKRDMKSEFDNTFESMAPGWKNFYGAAWQFTASDENYYTNFCMRLNSDTSVAKNNF